MTPLPCPFPTCAAARIGFVSSDAGVHVCCTKCGARGPFKQTTNRAIEAWNAALRAMQPSSEVV